jgi:hypothetical protein
MYGPDIALGTTAMVIITKPISSLLGSYSSDFSQLDDAATETILSAARSPGAYAAVLAGTDVRFGGSFTIQDNLVIGNQAYRGGGGM